ncbi:MAG: FecR family protein [Brevundimonas sp.]
MTGSIPDARIRKEAADWFARLNARTVSVGDLEAFRAWRATPAHRDAYAAVEAAWARSGALRDDPEIQAALAEAVVRPHRGPRFPMRGVAVAAGVAVLAFAGVGGWWLQTRPVTYSTATGERRLVRLEDGSEVHLDTATRLTARLRDGRRDLVLVSGQALFSVAHDPSRPFTVRAGDVNVIALGTRFDVRRDGEAVRVTLLEGGVSVKAEGAEARDWRLAPGQQIVAGGPIAPRPAPVDVRAAVAWTEGRLEFDGVPLSAAIAEVNRYETRPLRLAAGVDADLPISGVFDAGHGPAFAEAAAELHGLTVRVAPQEIRLEPGSG